MEKQILTRKELYYLVWSTSMVTLSKRFVISDTGLRKICDRMNIPIPGNGHWMKLQFKKEVNVTPLPEDSNVDQTVELELRKEGVDYSSDPIKKLAREIKIIVPGPLDSADMLIAIAKKKVKMKRSPCLQSYWYG